MAAVETVRPEGDRVATTTHDLYRQYGRQIYAYCFHKLRSREEAEDAVQTTFMNAFRALQRGTAMQFEQAWLYKIAQNVCFERQSSSSRRRLHEVANDFETLQEVVPARENDEPLELIGIEDALEAMPENQRRAILLREWQGLSYREISDELGLSQAAVEMLIFRARRSLAGALEKPDELRAKRRRVGRGITVGGLLSALKTLFGGGAAIKAVAAAAAAVVVVGESAQYTVVHRPQSHASRGAVSSVKSRLAAAAAVASHSAASHVSAAPTVAERSILNAPTAAAHAASSARASVAGPTSSAAQSRHAVTGHVGTSAPKADVEPTPPPAAVVAPPAPAPAPVVPAAAAPVPHPEVPAHAVVPAPPAKVAAPKVEKVEKAVTVTTTTPAPPVTVPAVTLPTLATEPPPPAPADTPGNGNAYGHTKDKGNPPVVTTPDAPVVPQPADNGNGHGKDKGDPQTAPVAVQPTVTTVTTVSAVPDHGNGRGNGNGHGKP